MGTAGQRCTSTRRVFVPRAGLAELEHRLVAAYEQVRIGDRDVTNQPIDPGAGTLDCELVVSRRTSGLVVTLAGVDGERAAEMALLVFNINPATWRPFSSAIALALADEGGRFRVEGLPPGAYHVLAVNTIPAGFRLRTRSLLEALTVKATSVTLPPDVETSLTLPIER